MKVLVVLAHPLSDSFAAALAQAIGESLTSAGHAVDRLDLYGEAFDPRLSSVERAAYMTDTPDVAAIGDHVRRLQEAEMLVLVFPQWWFNMPAILKGWIDRVFQPGIAFHPDPAGGRIRPGLDRLKRVEVVTTTGSPWWIVRFVMGDPVRRILRRGVFLFAAPKARFAMTALHDMDRATAKKRADFLAKIRRRFSAIRSD